MDKGNDNILRGWFSRRRFHLNRRFSIFLIFLGIAIFLWFLLALERTYITTVEHPVRYTGLPDDRLQVNDLPKKFSFEVEGTGFAILRHNWDLSKNPVRVDFDELVPNDVLNNKPKQVDIPIWAHRQRLSAQLDNLQLHNITPDTLTFSFTTMVSKKVPIQHDVEYELDQGYMLSGPVSLTPDSVIVKGPHLILDTLDFILTDRLNFKKINQSITRSLELINIDPESIELSESRTTMRLDVDQFTEKTVRVPVVPINVPDSVQLKTFPARVNITVRLVISQFDQIEAEQFEAIVDYLSIGEEPRVLKVTLNRQPPYIDNVRISPEVVDYIIEK